MVNAKTLISALVIAVLLAAAATAYVGEPVPSTAVTSTVSTSSVPVPKPRPTVKRHKLAVAPGAPLPYSCSTIRFWAATLPQSTQDALAEKNHVTPAQKAEAAKCFKK